MNFEKENQHNEQSEIAKKKLIDDAFYVEKGRFLWNGVDKEGKNLVSALTEEDCIRAARFYLKGLQEGWPDDTVKHEGTVGGKL